MIFKLLSFAQEVKILRSVNVNNFHLVLNEDYIALKFSGKIEALQMS